MLSSEAGLQPQLSFNLLCRCSPTHLVFFQDYISSYKSANISFTYSVCWITRCEYFFCKLFPQAMLQFGGLGLDGSIEISVSVIVTVSHLLG